MFLFQVGLSALLKQVCHILWVKLCEEVLFASQLLNTATDFLFLAQVLVVLFIELVCEEAILCVVPHAKQLIIEHPLVASLDTLLVLGYFVVSEHALARKHAHVLLLYDA